MYCSKQINSINYFTLTLFVLRLFKIAAIQIKYFIKFSVADKCK